MQGDEAVTGLTLLAHSVRSSSLKGGPAEQVAASGSDSKRQRACLSSVRERVAREPFTPQHPPNELRSFVLPQGRTCRTGRFWVCHLSSVSERSEAGLERGEAERLERFVREVHQPAVLGLGGRGAESDLR